MDQNHPYKKLRIPKDAPFELRPSPGKGWGVFAIRPIQRGELILKEKPLFVVSRGHGMRFDYEIEKEMSAAFKKLSAFDKQQYFCLRKNGSTEKFKRIVDAFVENDFSIGSGTDSGLFLLQSRFNHSCIPNTKIPTQTDGTVARYATKDISRGEELTFCYDPSFKFKNRQDRHEYLEHSCNCIACDISTPYQKLSDMRRTFMRGLQYLTNGVDLDCRKHGPQEDLTTPLFLDLSYKRKAENFRVRLSTRLIAGLLTIAMLEEEGLLDDLMLQRMQPALKVAGWFKTKSNVAIVKRVMKQSTWAGKFNESLWLWNRDDSADEEVMVGMKAYQAYSALNMRV
ncbi:SET domain-containing protein [Microthyrium microscopicum]|uniref:SET domain-containing protein n=1 Tax=Microthyrium microscopicum TaxID=703497 RepID=A0A6A6U7E5_9PEZI|nr:SET domain-containing protein [Microthyrium microscopicum]